MAIKRLGGDDQATRVRAARDKKLVEVFEPSVNKVSGAISCANKSGYSSSSLKDLLNDVYEYGQALRDIPEQAGFPESVVWPVPPDVSNLCRNELVDNGEVIEDIETADALYEAQAIVTDMDESQIKDLFNYILTAIRGIKNG